MPIEIPANESFECDVVISRPWPGPTDVTFSVYLDANGYLHIEDIALNFTTPEGEMPEELARQLEAMANDSADEESSDSTDESEGDSDQDGR